MELCVSSQQFFVRNERRECHARKNSQGAMAASTSSSAVADIRRTRLWRSSRENSRAAMAVFTSVDAISQVADRRRTSSICGDRTRLWRSSRFSRENLVFASDLVDKRRLSLIEGDRRRLWRGKGERFSICSVYEGEGGGGEEEEEEEEGEKKRTVGVFWDLDNKPPKGVQPYKAAISLRDLASEFGLVVDMVAYANRHAFTYVPQWIRDERQERRRLNVLEQQGVVTPDEPYRCQYCGRKCQTYVKLRKHFKQLHERERNKRISHLNHLKGGKKQRYKAKLAEKEDKYQTIASQLLAPKVGYGLAPELKRAGVYVRTVEDRPQAADDALIKHMNVYINRGLETLILVSDDSDFVNILRLASMRNLQTIVIGDTMTLSRHADISFSWDEVASGRAQSAAAEAHLEWINKAALMRELEDDSDLYPERDDDSEFVPLRPNSTVSAFSEDEEWESDDDDDADESTWEDDSDEEEDEEESAFEDFSPWSRSSVTDQSNKVY